jgi:hypothetical protein
LAWRSSYNTRVRPPGNTVRLRRSKSLGARRSRSIGSGKAPSAPLPSASDRRPAQIIGSTHVKAHCLASGRNTGAERNTDPHPVRCSRPFVLLTGGQARDCPPVHPGAPRRRPSGSEPGLIAYSLHAPRQIRAKLRRLGLPRCRDRMVDLMRLGPSLDPPPIRAARAEKRRRPHFTGVLSPDSA